MIIDLESKSPGAGNTKTSEINIIRCPRAKYDTYCKDIVPQISDTV
nr:MAG TPA: hypothetical protein [Caudoviricetes sp.]